MKQLFIFGLIISISFGNSLHTKIISGFDSPENIYGDDKNIYVSNIGKNNFKQNTSGYISKLDLSGKIIEKKFIKGFSAPKGIYITQNILYVVDINTLKGFDLKSKKQIFYLPIKGAIFLSGITGHSKNILYVSDRATGVIYQIDLLKREYKSLIHLDTKKYGGPSGLMLDKNILYITGYDFRAQKGGLILYIDLDERNYIPVAVSEVRDEFDGVTMDSHKNLLVSGWGDDMNGSIYRIDKRGRISKLDIKSLKGPGGIFYDDKNLWIPMVMENKIIKVKF